MLSKKVLVFFLIVIQALLLLFVFITGIWRLDSFNTPKLSSMWTSWRNDSEEVEQGAELFGLIDLNDQHFSWLNKEAKNVTRTTYTPTVYITTTSTLPITVNSTLSNSPGSRLLYPVIKHKKDEIFLMVFVTTIPQKFETRELIRNTWASARVNQLTQEDLNSNDDTNITYVVFMLGRSGNVEQDLALEEEAEKYGDIIRGPHHESYRNIISKVWYAFEWAQQYQPKYILKVDDDIYVRIPRFSSWLSEGKAPYRLYGGYVHYRAYISRNPKDKHYVSRSEYRKRFFPNYCAGPCYTFSGELLDEFIDLSKSVPKFQVEDAYLGLIAKMAGVKPFDIGGKLFVWDRSLSRTVRTWTDKRLSRVICLGDSLTPEAVKYIHKRYLEIDNNT